MSIVNARFEARRSHVTELGWVKPSLNKSKHETSSKLPPSCLTSKVFNNFSELGKHSLDLDNSLTMKRKAENDDPAPEPQSPKSKRRAIEDTSSRDYFRQGLFNQVRSDEYRRLYANSKP
jgi:hypothetical protein